VAVDNNRVAGVIAAAIANYPIAFFRQQIRYFSLSLIPKLGSYHNCCFLHQKKDPLSVSQNEKTV
jgi:hypothetical protein